MKFQELNKEQRTAALNHCLTELLRAILEHGLRFNDKLNKDRLQARIDKAIRKADELRTPWFAHELILEDSYCKERLESMALCDAEDSDFELNSSGALCVVERRLVKVGGLS